MFNHLLCTFSSKYGKVGPSMTFEITPRLFRDPDSMYYLRWEEENRNGRKTNIVIEGGGKYEMGRL